jgi:hypothetical protein
VLRRSGFQRKKTADRLIGRAHLAVTEGGRAAVGPTWRLWAERREADWVAVAHERGEGTRAERGRKRGGPRLDQKGEEGRWTTVGPETRFRIGLPEKNRKGFEILAAKLNLKQDNFEFKAKDIFKVKLQFKLKIKFKKFTNGNLGFVSKIQI